MHAEELPGAVRPHAATGSAGSTARPFAVSVTYAADNSAGDTNGQGVNAYGALWYVLSAGGSEITRSSSNSGTNGY